MDFLIDNKKIHNANVFEIKAYRSDKSTKVPICFQLNKNPIDNVVIDYYEQEILDDCNGVNIHQDYIRLGCDLVELG